MDNKKTKKSIEAQYAEEYNTRIIQLLVLEREKKGLSMQHIGDSMGGLPKSSIHRFEKGAYNLTLIKFIEYCKILEVDPAEIIRRAKK